MSQRPVVPPSPRAWPNRGSKPPWGAGHRPAAAYADERVSRAPGGGGRTGRTLHRRRVLLVALLVAAAASLVLAFVVRRGPIWGVHATTDALLVVYLALLIHARNAAAYREMSRRVLAG
jgi:hypothetical protein